MSLKKIQQKDIEIKEAILDVLAYYAIMSLRVDFETIYKYLPVKASHLAVKKQLNNLIKRGRVKLVKDKYGLASATYKSQEPMQAQQEKLMLKARRWARLFKLIPAVKSVVVINSVAIGNPHDESDIDLFIITSPNRIFLTKGFLMYLLRLIRQLEDQHASAGRFSLGMFLTTKGAKMEKDMMKVNEPDLVFRMITGLPVYGGDVWYSILKADPYLNAKLPNYVWPKMPMRIYGVGSKFLDRLDDVAYRKHLKHTASQPKSHHPDAFIRVRPDIINLHHKGTSHIIAEKWQTARSKA
jgi:predicted nucleotidyltransferase